MSVPWGCLSCILRITTAFQAAVGDIDATNRYTLLHAWILTTLHAGIASRQSSDL